MNEIKVLVSPIFDPWYYEFFIKGLIDYYGKNNVQFSYDTRFIRFYEFTSTKYRKAFLYYEIKVGNCSKKVVISAEDWTDFHSDIYEEVDCYALVNITNEQLNKNPKLLPIGPSFGIRNFSLIQYLKFSWKLKKMAKIHNPYWGTFKNNSLKRSFYKEYEKDSVKEIRNQTFYLNYPWGKHPSVTEIRKSIIIILKRLEKNKSIKFIGGFSKRRFGYHKGLKELSTDRIYNHTNYLKALKKAGFVINTPAVHDCLGWKLGEYLALGKTIISLPLGRAMPGDFIVGKHYHEIKEIGELENAVNEIVINESYRSNLAKNAKMYYDSYLGPENSIRRIHQFLYEDNIANN